MIIEANMITNEGLYNKFASLIEFIFLSYHLTGKLCTGQEF